MAKNAITDWDASVASNNSDIGGIDIAENCDAANINNAIRELMKQVASWLAALYAVVADVLAGTSTTKAITPKALKDAVAFQTLTASASAISPDLANGLNFTHTLTASITLNNIASLVEGYSGTIEFIQDGTGGWTVSKPASGNKYKGPGGFPTVDTTASAKSVFTYVVRSTSEIWLFPARTMSAA